MFQMKYLLMCTKKFHHASLTLLRANSSKKYDKSYNALSEVGLRLNPIITICTLDSV